MPISYRPLAKEDVANAYALESASYPADEAASLTSLAYRQQHATKYFLGAFEEDELVGFVCSTRTSSSTLTHESMDTHEPAGEYLAIHSVCVSPRHRHRGIAKHLVAEYVRRVESFGEVSGIRLIAKEQLVGMYERSGFASRGKSQVVHGKDPWYELGCDFPRQAKIQSLPFDLEEDVDPASVRSPGKRLATKTLDGEAVGRELVRDGKNRFDLYCPRAECKCLLVKRGAASWVVKGTHNGDIELPPLPRRIDAPTGPGISSPHLGYWTLSSPLAFENVGFTRSLPSSSPHPSTPLSTEIKYLTCADCDFGPLGWHDTEGRDLGLEVQEENEGGSARGSVRKGREFLVDLERVRYKFE